MEITFCEFFTTQMGYCGHIATHGTRCAKHLGKEMKKINSPSPRFRGDSKWQLEQGLGTHKTGSNV